MQMQSVDTRAGTAICAAPSRMASRWGCPSSKYRSMFSIVTVASSTRIPTARANPPRVMMLMVSPRKLRVITDVKMDRGIPNDLDWEVVQLRDRFRTGVQSNVVFELTHLCRSRRQNEILLLHGSENILWS